MKTKTAYLIHVFRKGIYHHTVSLVFTSRKAADKFAGEYGMYCEIQQVECISSNMF